MKKSVYPGSFDPVTSGHMDVIERSLRIFDKVTVAVLINYEKKSTFTIEEKLDFLRRSTKHMKNIEIDSYKGLLIDYMKQKKANIIIRGLRAVSDFEHEYSIASLIARMSPDLETIFMMTKAQYSFLSSSMVKDLAHNGGKIRGLVPEAIEKDIIRIISERRGTM